MLIGLYCGFDAQWYGVHLVAALRALRHLDDGHYFVDMKLVLLWHFLLYLIGEGAGVLEFVIAFDCCANSHCSHLHSFSDNIASRGVAVFCF